MSYVDWIVLFATAWLWGAGIIKFACFRQSQREAREQLEQLKATVVELLDKAEGNETLYLGTLSRVRYLRGRLITAMIDIEQQLRDQGAYSTHLEGLLREGRDLCANLPAGDGGGLKLTAQECDAGMAVIAGLAMAVAERADG